MTASCYPSHWFLLVPAWFIAGAYSGLLFTVAFLGVSPLGSLVAGALANVIGAPHTLAIGAGCSLLGAAVLWRQLPRLRANIRPIYVRLGIIQE